MDMMVPGGIEYPRSESNLWWLCHIPSLWPRTRRPREVPARPSLSLQYWISGQLGFCISRTAASNSITHPFLLVDKSLTASREPLSPSHHFVHLQSPEHCSKCLRYTSMNFPASSPSVARNMMSILVAIFPFRSLAFCDVFPIMKIVPQAPVRGQPGWTTSRGLLQNTSVPAPFFLRPFGV